MGLRHRRLCLLGLILSTIKNLDCKSTAAGYTFAPVYYACFEWKSLPQSFKAKLGPTTSTDPNVFNCTDHGYPSTQIDIVLTRQGCDFVWAWSNGSIGVLFSTGNVAPLMGGTPNMPDIGAQMTNGTYWYLLNGTNPTGSCSYNPITNETSFTYSDVIVEEPGCSTPITITYQGV